MSGPSSLVSLHAWPHAALMSEIDDRIAKLQEQIDSLHHQQAELRRQLAQAQLDQWQGRFEDLELQLHLGAKETSDKVSALTGQLRARWADARRQLEESISTASSVADTVRTGMEKAYADLRAALLDSRNQVIPHGKPGSQKR